VHEHERLPAAGHAVTNQPAVDFDRFQHRLDRLSAHSVVPHCTLLRRSAEVTVIDLRRGEAQWPSAPVAQWIEQRFPKPRAQVRFLPGALLPARTRFPNGRRVTAATTSMGGVASDASARALVRFRPGALLPARTRFPNGRRVTAATTCMGGVANDASARALVRFELVWDAAEYSGLEPFPREFLERLVRLIPADAMVGYHEVESSRPWRVVEAVEIPAEGVPAGIQQAATPFCPQDPLQNRMRRDERRVLKLSDCLTRREMRKLGMYHCVWKQLGIEDSVRVWFPAPPGRARTMYLERGKRDFCERDRSLLELLRPSLIKMVERADRRRRSDISVLLTPREREILRWIEGGKTTREIAAVLVVSPHTVRKHVENILEKLGARTRSEAVARVVDAR
jgi:DNA-binding CsgD family transcriptional regulator